MHMRRARTTLLLCSLTLGSDAFAEPPREYNLELMVATGGALTSIDDRVSINDIGAVGFSGVLGGLSGVIVADAPGSFASISTGNASTNFLGGSINNTLPVTAATRRRVNGPRFFAETWRAGARTTIGDSGDGDFDSAAGFPDINDRGVMVFPGLIGGSTSLALFAGDSQGDLDQVAVYPGTTARLRPQVSNSNEIVIRDNLGRIMVYDVGIGFPEVVAGVPAIPEFNLCRPGISADGHAVGFIGDVGEGQGVYLAIREPDSVLGTRTLYKVAARGAGFTSFPDEQRVGVWTRVMENDDDYIFTRVVFAAERNGVLGVYTASVSILEDQAMPLGIPTLVMKVGDAVGGKTITGIQMYDPVNAKGVIAVRATFSDGSSGVVRATGRTHILAIGVNWASNNRFDVSAEYFIHSALALVHSSDVTFLPLAKAGPNNVGMVRAELDRIYPSLKPDDRLLMYLMVHGAGFVSAPGSTGDETPLLINFDPANLNARAFSSNDEYLQMSEDASHQNEWWTDDAFADYFADPSRPRWSSTDKLFVMNACFSGGFWYGGASDVSGDLSRLPRCALLAAAPEDTFAWFNPGTNKSLLVMAMEGALPSLAALPAAHFADLASAIQSAAFPLNGIPGVIVGFPDNPYEPLFSDSHPSETTVVAEQTLDFSMLFGPPPCPADFNLDGFVDFFDYSDFVACFEGSVCPAGASADFNGDGFADFFDYGDYVDAFEVGC